MIEGTYYFISDLNLMALQVIFGFDVIKACFGLLFA